MTQPDIVELSFVWRDAGGNEEEQVFRFYGHSVPIPDVGEQVTLIAMASSSPGDPVTGVDPKTFVVRDRAFNYILNGPAHRNECSVIFEVEEGTS